MITEVVLPPAWWISHGGGGGWIVTHPDDRSVTVLDPDLRVVARVDVAVTAARFGASVTDRHLAVVTVAELVVYDRLGMLLWRREHAAGPAEPACHLDHHGVLWVYPPVGGEVTAHDAATGDVIDRARLGSPQGAGYLWPHPDGRQLGLHVARGQDTPPSHLVRLTDGRIVVRDLPGGFLNGFTCTGARYLVLAGDVPQIAIRDLSSGAALVACDPTDIPGYDRDGDYQLMEAAALVTDDFVLVAVTADDAAGDYEHHLLLSTRSLRWQADVTYGHDMAQNAIAATDGRGRWLTRERSGTVRLWELPKSVTDENHGQLQLW